MTGTKSADSTNLPIGRTEFAPPPLVTRTVRVAMYLETNTTLPNYATTGWLEDNTTGVQRILQAAGYQVTNLTRADISQHKLMTASYDVFVMVDNMPRENITDLVKEFWLGGGGILSLDSAISYINYAGMIPPESEGHENYDVYWNYGNSYTRINVTARHPVTEAYSIKEHVNTSNVDWATFNWQALQGTRVAGDLVKLGTEVSLSNNASMVALDPSLKGGCVVQLPCSSDPLTPDMQRLIVDSVNWLCPHPKARILFDFSHKPWYGIDPWDTYTVSSAQYAQLRNALVNRSYTFDKLYPSASGNLTPSKLAPYDLLIVELPYLNFTAAEVTAVANWISSGHGLLALGDNPSVSTYNKNINYLLSSFDLKIENVHNKAPGAISYFVKHPTTESCTNLYVGGSNGGYINYTGTAYPIWGSDAVNAIFGAQAYGDGRVILAADIDWATNSGITYNNNYQYSVNVANWLTSSKTDVLVYVFQSGGANPWRRVYRGPVASALNDLGVGFYLTFTSDYFNFTLHQQTWSLVIVDQPSDNFAAPNYFLEILDYMKAGGHLVLSTWQYGYSPGIPLFDYLGFGHMNNFTTPPSIYVWDNAHGIFTQPNLYSAGNITSTHNHWAVDCANLTIYSNASAIAGLSRITSTTNASIVLGAGGRAIVNAMLLTEYYDDTDDSTYADSFEIWENEIAYVLRPQCSLTPSVVSNVYKGTILNVHASVASFGLCAAMQGQVSLSVPAGLGTLLSPAAQSLASPLDPSTSDTVSWKVNVTGTGSHTLSFAAAFKGFKGTSYSAFSTADTLTLAPPTPVNFAQYGFAVESNATSFQVAAWTTPPAGTGEPSTGLHSFIYLNMTGTIPPGYSVAYVKLYFSRARVQQLGLNETVLSFYRWNNATSQWQAISGTVQLLNSTHGLVTLYLDHFSYFAVFASLVPTGGGMGNTLLLIIGLAAIVIVVVVAVLVLKKRK